MKANEVGQVELLYRDIEIQMNELRELRAWKQNVLAEIETLIILAECNRDSYISAAMEEKRASKRNYEREHKVSARASENQYWLNRLNSVHLKIK